MKNKKMYLNIGIIVIIIMALVCCIKLWVEYVDYYIKYEKRMNEITQDDLEIERKWLINANEIPYNLEKAEVYKYEQTYISFSPEMRVRKINENMYTFTLKTNLTENGIQRDEVEFYINENEYNKLVQKKEGNTIYKTRYQFYEDNQLMAVDIFEGELSGLAYLEIEFPNNEEAEKYKEPEWVIKEVTSDVNYKNGYLARYGIPSK